MAKAVIILATFGLLISFSYVFCMDDGEDVLRAVTRGPASTVGAASITSRLSSTDPQSFFTKTHASLVTRGPGASFCKDLFDGPPESKPIRRILDELSRIVDGNATAQKLEDVRNHTLIINALVFSSVHILNEIKACNQRTIWVVARLISLLLRDVHLSTGTAWLTHVLPLGDDPLEHLVGRDTGVATVAITHLTRGGDWKGLETTGQGTNMLELTHMFMRGAELFLVQFLESQKLALGQRTQLKSEGLQIFTGPSVEVSALQIFETAILTANFEAEKERLELSVGRYTLNIDQLQDRLRDHAAQLVSSRAADAARIIQLEEELGATTAQITDTRAANTDLLQRASGAEAQLVQSQSEIARLGDQVASLRSQATLTANFEAEKERLELSVGRYTLNIDQLQDRLRDHAAQLVSSRAADAARIIQLEEELGATTAQITDTRAANTDLLQRASGAEAQLVQSQSEIARLGDQVASLRSQATGLKSILAGIPWCLRCCCCIPNPDDEDEVRRPLLVQ